VVKNAARVIFARFKQRRFQWSHGPRTRSGNRVHQPGIPCLLVLPGHHLLGLAL